LVAGHDKAGLECTELGMLKDNQIKDNRFNFSGNDKIYLFISSFCLKENCLPMTSNARKDQFMHLFVELRTEPESLILGMNWLTIRYSVSADYLTTRY